VGVVLGEWRVASGERAARRFRIQPAAEEPRRIACKIACRGHARIRNWCRNPRLERARDERREEQREVERHALDAEEHTRLAVVQSEPLATQPRARRPAGRIPQVPSARK
jgi:hypothetical protein